MNAPLPGDIDVDKPFGAALDVLLTSLTPAQIRAFINTLAAHEADMARVEARQGHPAPREPYHPRQEAALALLRCLGVTDARVDAARLRIESGEWGQGRPPSLSAVQ
jgi:hypothetical protein